MEFNTMPGWAGSSWYFLRYMDAHNENEFVAKEKSDYWNQVDLYIGGSEHATGHLLYSRFWTKFLFDLGHISFDEPFKKLINQGMILGRSSILYRDKFNPDIYVSAEERLDYHNKNLDSAIVDEDAEKVIFKEGSYKERFQELRISIDLIESDILDTERLKNWMPEYKNAKFYPSENNFKCGFEVEKMSKRWFNVQTPDELCEKFGADTLRCYEMFLGPLEQSKPWDVKGINGVHNFLKKLWRLFHDTDGNLNVSEGEADKKSLKTLHTLIKKYKEDLDRYSFNTIVSGFMIAVNELQDQKCNNKAVLSDLLIMLSAYAPHMAEELWSKLGNTESIAYANLPKFNPSFLEENSYAYPVSFNGKMRFKIELPTNLSKDDIEKEVMAYEKTAQYLDGKDPKKVIVVPKKIVNVVV